MECSLVSTSHTLHVRLKNKIKRILPNKLCFCIFGDDVKKQKVVTRLVLSFSLYDVSWMSQLLYLLFKGLRSCFWDFSRKNIFEFCRLYIVPFLAQYRIMYFELLYQNGSYCVYSLLFLYFDTFYYKNIYRMLNVEQKE